MEKQVHSFVSADCIERAWGTRSLSLLLPHLRMLQVICGDFSAMPLEQLLVVAQEVCEALDRTINSIFCLESQPDWSI